MVGRDGTRPRGGLQRHTGLERLLGDLREHAGADIGTGAVDSPTGRWRESTLADGEEYVLRIAHATMRAYDTVMRNDCYFEFGYPAWHFLDTIPRIDRM
jgi:hypothetical protein